MNQTTEIFITRRSMKQIILQVMIVLVSMTSCTHNRTETDNATVVDSTCSSTPMSDEEAFVSFAEHFSETTSFAYATISGRSVLLVSQETFGDNDSTTKEAIEATIFAQDSKGKIICLGSIRSQGTNYPVTLLDGKLAVAGHYFMRVYSIRGDAPELVLDSSKEGYGAEMDSMYETFFKGTPVKFYKKLQK